MVRKRWTTIFVALMILPACDPARVESDAITDPPSVEDVAEQQDEYLHREVELVGVVENVFGRCAFEIEDETSGLFEDSLLVLCSAIPPADQGGFTPPEVRAGDRLRLVGDIAEMTRESYEYKTTATLSEDQFGPRETREVFWAESFEIVREDEPSS